MIRSGLVQTALAVALLSPTNLDAQSSTLAFRLAAGLEDVRAAGRFADGAQFAVDASLGFRLTRRVIAGISGLRGFSLTDEEVCPAGSGGAAGCGSPAGAEVSAMMPEVRLALGPHEGRRLDLSVGAGPAWVRGNGQPSMTRLGGRVGLSLTAFHLGNLAIAGRGDILVVPGEDGARLVGAGFELRLP